MMKVHVEYPDFEAEKSILGLKMQSLGELQPLLNTSILADLKETVDKIYVDEKLKDLIVKIVHSTRPGNEHFLKKYDGAIMAGASPRAAIWLYKIAKFKAFMGGNDFVSPENVLSIAKAVLGHRVLLSYEAIIDKVDVRDVVHDIASECL